MVADKAAFFWKGKKMQIVTKQIADLRQSKKNVRLHGDRQIKEYIRSIEMFGQVRPLVIDENNVVLCGNGLLQALKQMGRETADCYVVAGMSERKKKKLMLADNKIYELGANNQEAFNDILKDLAGDIDVPGYDENLLKVLSESAREVDDFISSYDDSNVENNEDAQKVKTPSVTMTIQTSRVKEIDTKDFSDEKFNCTCPRCGFKFNV